MAKETFYFSHDYDPTNDPKMAAMLSEHGGLGYGIYWRIIEMLHNDDTHRLPLKKYIYLAIAQQMSTSVEMVEKFIKTCIDEYELFVKNDTSFYSNRVDRNISKRALISEKRSFAGKQSACVKQNSTNVKHMSTKERKVKYIDIKNIYSKYSFFSNGFEKVWQDFKDARIKLKKPLTATAENLNLAKLEKLSDNNKETAIKIVNRTIEKGWLGFFPYAEDTEFKPQSNSTEHKSLQSEW